MTRIIHLSDPHFGTVPDGLAQRLLDCVQGLRPDAVVLSGDLTQRARKFQYSLARQFLEGLPAPVLAVPGNHDVPLWNLPLRLTNPWRGWRRGLGLPLETVLAAGDAAILGLNSANPCAWKDGRVTAAQLAHLRDVFSGVGARRRIVALHHPPEPPEGEPASLMGAEALIETCKGAGVEMILSGHLHFTQVAPLAAASGLLAVQAGTCLSSRTRRDGNAFTLLDLTAQGVEVRHFRLGADGAFGADAATVWTRGKAGWR